MPLTGVIIEIVLSAAPNQARIARMVIADTQSGTFLQSLASLPCSIDGTRLDDALLRIAVTSRCTPSQNTVQL